MHNRTIAPDASVDPAARLSATTLVGPEVQIGAQVVCAERVQIGASTRILGAVTIQYGVTIGSGVTLMGPLLIEQDVLIEDGATIGVVVAAGSLLEQGVIHTGARIGAKAEVLGRLAVGEYARVQPGARLEGDLPGHALAAGKPAALATFICACGQEYRSIGRNGAVYNMQCPACGSDYRLGMPDLQRRGRFLLANQAAGEEVPAWWSA